MYYLKKESYEMEIDEIKKVDGTIIPKRAYKTEDRALYKSTTMNRFYRRSYPNPNEKGLKLYECKTLKTILEHRESLYKYCGEYFDVYCENGKVNLEDN